MSAKYIFNLKSEDRRRELPGKVIIGRAELETVKDVVVKFLAFLLFYRERIQIEVNLHIDSIPFTPDVAQLDYELRPRLWVECGDCGVAKLNKLAVKVPEAEIWVVKRSVAEAQLLYDAMAKGELRRDRYGLIGLDSVFANGIRWERTKLGPLTQEIYRERMASLPKLISRFDNFASVIFSFAFLVVFIILMSFPLVGLFALLAYGVSHLLFSGDRFLTIFISLAAILVILPMSVAVIDQR